MFLIALEEQLLSETCVRLAYLFPFAGTNYFQLDSAPPSIAARRSCCHTPRNDTESKPPGDGPRLRLCFRPVLQLLLRLLRGGLRVSHGRPAHAHLRQTRHGIAQPQRPHLGPHAVTILPKVTATTGVTGISTVTAVRQLQSLRLLRCGYGGYCDNCSAATEVTAVWQLR